jgi:AraC-like DNA-binding protein
MTADADAASVFSTSALPRESRVELWEDHNLQELFHLQCRPLGGSPLEATMVKRAVGGLQLARIQGTPHLVERSTASVRSQPSDSIALYLTLKGEALFYHEDAVRAVRPGQLLICDVDRPFLRGFSQGLEELAITVPRETFRAITGEAGVETPRLMEFAQGTAGARTLARLVGRAVRPVDPRPIQEEVVIGLMADLVSGRSGDPGVIHLVTAHAFIDEHLGDPALSAGRVADAVGISERQLSRVFADSGSTVPRYVLGRRLDLARRLLDTEPGISVAEVAGRAGFGSATYLSRAFRDRFGERAVDVRREARARRG